MSHFQPGDRVLYVPGHARGDPKHPDCQRGTVSSVGTHYVFVRFNTTAIYGQACDPQDLVPLLERKV